MRLKPLVSIALAAAGCGFGTGPTDLNVLGVYELRRVNSGNLPATISHGSGRTSTYHRMHVAVRPGGTWVRTQDAETCIINVGCSGIATGSDSGSWRITDDSLRLEVQGGGARVLSATFSSDGFLEGCAPLGSAVCWTRMRFRRAP
jgi:hypothetical protein